MSADVGRAPGAELVVRTPVDVTAGGRRPRGRAARLAALADVPAVLLDRRDDRPARLTRFYRGAVQGVGPVDVVQLTAARAVDVGADLAAAGRFVGDEVVHRDLTPPDPTPAGGARSAPDPLPTLVSLRRPRVDGPALGLLRGARTAVLVVETRGTRPATLLDALDLLDGLEVAVVGLVVHRGRLPRR